MSLEEAVRCMTSAAAARLGLTDRGLVRDGYAADVVIFDPGRVRATATYEDPRRYPEGVEWVLVGGVPVVADGEHTGARPGHVLRRGVRAQA
jgi:N-acyl-D-amino-acid deacylase